MESVNGGNGHARRPVNGSAGPVAGDMGRDEDAGALFHQALVDEYRGGADHAARKDVREVDGFGNGWRGAADRSRG